VHAPRESRIIPGLAWVAPGCPHLRHSTYSTTHEILLAWLFSLALNATAKALQTPLLFKLKPFLLWALTGPSQLAGCSCCFPAPVPR